MSAQPRLDVGQLTHRGQVRERNEDHYGLPPPNLGAETLAAKGRLYVVADGMGGHEGGQRASHLAVQRIVAEYYGDPTPDPQYSLARAIRLANTEIYQEAQRDPALEKMGTTITATVILGQDLLVANVGDSRTYLLRDGGAKQLTQDHSLIAQALREGTVTPDQVETHPYRGVITRALGSRPTAQPDFFRASLQAGDKLLLCSDGLTNEVSDDLIVATISRSKNAQDATRQLVDLANKNGGRDNVTAIVVGLNGASATAAAGSRRVPAWLFLLAAGVLAVALALTAVAIFYRPGGTGTPTKVAVQSTAALAETTPLSPGSESPTAGSVGEEAAVVQPTTTATASDLAAVTASETPTSTLPGEAPTPDSTVPPPTATLEPSRTPTLTQAPRATSPPATSTPELSSYPPPVPEQPQDGARLEGRETIELRWGWDGTLGQDEHYDVRVWREGQEHLGVAWTTDPFYPLNMRNQGDRLVKPEPKGTYYWAVAIIRGQGGQVLKVLSPESSARTFYWEPPSSGGGGEKPPDQDKCASCDCDSMCARGACNACCADCCGGCK